MVQHGTMVAMTASTLAQNPYSFHNPRLDQLRDQLGKIVQKSEQQINPSFFPPFIEAVEHRIFSRISSIGRDLHKYLQYPHPRGKLCPIAKEIDQIVTDILREVKPTTSLVVQANQRIQDEIARLLDERRLENTFENRCAVTDPALASIKMSPRQWLAFRLDMLNLEASIPQSKEIRKIMREIPSQKTFEKVTREMLSRTIEKIQNLKKDLDQRQAEGRPLSAKTAQLCDAIFERIEEIDYDGSIRYELNTLTGKAAATFRRAVQQSTLPALLFLRRVLQITLVFQSVSIASDVRSLLFRRLLGLFQ